jgi:hypothetical protein
MPGVFEARLTRFHAALRQPFLLSKRQDHFHGGSKMPVDTAFPVLVMPAPKRGANAMQESDVEVRL